MGLSRLRTAPTVPIVEELLRTAGVGVVPEPAEVFFDGPGTAGLQRLVLQGIQSFLVFPREVLGVEQP